MLVDGWDVESNRFGPYLVLDGEEGDMAKVVDALERSDVQVRYWNKSVRSSTRPRAAEWKPDPERLAMRYEWFRAARTVAICEAALASIASGKPQEPQEF